MDIHYEPHPVTPERKAELRAMGKRIVDARFAPAGWKPDAIQTEETQTETPPPVKRRGRPRKGD